MPPGERDWSDHGITVDTYKQATLLIRKVYNRVICIIFRGQQILYCTEFYIVNLFRKSLKFAFATEDKHFLSTGTTEKAVLMGRGGDSQSYQRSLDHFRYMPSKFSFAVVTNYHQLGGLQQRKCMSSWFWRSEILCAGLHSFWRLQRKNPISYFFQLLPFGGHSCLPPTSKPSVQQLQMSLWLWSSCHPSTWILPDLHVTLSTCRHLRAIPPGHHL